MCEGLLEKYGEMPFVFAGGVMCNSIIKAKLKEKFEAYFAEPMMSADNAVGIVELTRQRLLS
jgi:N6-L-threonylcarbamoyladenine synthase